MRIVCENLSFSYDDKRSKNKKYALSGVNLSINEGEFFGIIGQTGSGKSTLIRHFNGLELLQEGSLKIGEFDLNPKQKNYKKILKPLREKVGMVFQYPEYQLFADTVFADVAFALKNFRPELSDSEVCVRVAAAMEAVGLGFNEYKEKSPFELSGGQKRRVAIAGVLVAEPEILVLDEPVAGLDPLGKKELMALLHKLNDGGKTIVIVSHDMDEVAENCDRVALMENGRAVAIGSPKEIFLSKNGAGERMILPLTARLVKYFDEKGIVLDCDLTPDSFVEAVKNAVQNGKNSNT